MEKVDNPQVSSEQTQHSLLYLSIYTHGFAVPAMLDVCTMQSYVSCKLAAKLSAIIQSMTPLTIMLPTGKTMVATTAIQLDMVINDFTYM